MNTSLVYRTLILLLLAFAILPVLAIGKAEVLAEMLGDAKTHIYICGLKGMETGVEAAFHDIAAEAGMDWPNLRDMMRDSGRYHVETY